MSEDRSLERIAGLLNQAENTDNEAEAATFMEAAQRLATLRGVDLAKARTHTKSKESTKPVQRTVLIGKAGTRGLKTYVDLFLGVAAANDVQVTIYGNNTHVTAYGYEDDINMVERLYASLVVQMVTASRAFIKTGEYKSETVTKWVRDASGWGDYREVPISAVTARLEFQKAFADRIKMRLLLVKRTAEAEAEREDALRELEAVVLDEEPVSTALVLADKKKSVHDFFKENTRHIRGRYQGHRSSTYSRIARGAGNVAADKARLSGSQELPGARKGLR